MAIEAFQENAALDSENLTAHYTLAQIYSQLGDGAKAAYHRQEHEKYLPDYNAQDRAISIARRANPAADHAAQATVIYPLQRPGAPELSKGLPSGSQNSGVAQLGRSEASHEPQDRARHSVRAVEENQTTLVGNRGAQRTDAPYQTFLHE